ncbi:endoplasmic reticulum aminopeptidase 1-like isoform X2 [Dreissena polymorpha]|uniref:endoplasmic reticulum aminopeptidase 1-like isoform X2 n=1 Tax=Dreissena polymorpha TaxID=45954 RepID=UPI00226536AC|nr:endoplasmic reticulum aminopeptidase 1-like isoform X2 [Dreissena polymorpha]
MSDNEIEDVSFLPGESLHRRAVYERGIIQRFRFVACTKAKIALGLVLVVLIIIIVALSATIANHQDTEKSSSEKVIENEKQQTTTLTPVSTPNYTATNGQPFPYHNIRLPHSVTPVSYKMYMHPNISESFFTGHVSIICDVNENTDFIVFHAKGLTIMTIKVSDNSVPTNLFGVVNWLEHEDNEQIYVRLMKYLPKGLKINMYIEYNGTLGTLLHGFYKSSYLSSSNEKRYIATTHFEPTHAREAFPSFDEPAMKATFEMTMIRDEQHFSLFNMPLKVSTKLDNGLYQDEFETSVKMSTYLVAFVVCDYKNVSETTKRKIQVRVFAPPDFIGSASYALEVAVKVIDYYEDYFGVKYPLPKQDLIAIPDFEAGAMENWGLITYRMADVLYDRDTASTHNKQNIAVVIAHELAHQWFGNLVTMDWWDDLWLNEGFASYVEYLGTDIVDHDWRMGDQFVTDALLRAAYLDSLANSHPISQPVSDPGQINELFDAISYSKGASIIRMLNNYIGEDVFKAGLVSYLNKYNYGNAQTQDLWSSLSEAASHAKLNTNVTRLMNTWTGQTGYPVVKVTRSRDKMTLTQSRFLLNTSPNAQNGTPSPYGYKWEIPFCYTTQTEPERPVKQLLTDVTATVDGILGDWVKGNCGMYGFYRVNYDPDTWRGIIRQLNQNHTVFSVPERAGLLDDAFMLARVGQLDYSVALDLSLYLVNEEDYVPWSSFLDSIAFLSDRLESKPVYSAFKAYLLKLMMNRLKTISEKDWLKFENISDLEKYLKAAIIDKAVGLGYAPVLENGRQQFMSWLTNKTSLNVDLKAVIYMTGVMTGDGTVWESVWKRYNEARDDNEKRKLLYALASTKEARLLSRLLHSSLNESEVRSQDAPMALSSVATSYTGQILAWRFLQQNWDTIVSRYGDTSFMIPSFIKSACSNFDSKFDYEDVRSFFEAHDPKSGKRAIQQVLEKIQANINWVSQYEQKVVDWLNKKSH